MELNWYGSISQGSGYAGSGEHIVIALERLGYDVRVVAFSKTINENLTTAGLQIKRKPFKKSEVAICYGFPVAFSSIADYKYRFGFSMFETDRLPGADVWAGPNTVSSCDRLNMLFVPSKHSKQLFIDSGVTAPIEIVHLGVDDSFYKFFDRPKNKAIFSFLHLGRLGIRKNSGLVIAAFLTAFKDNPNVKLVLKSSDPHYKKYHFTDKRIEVVANPSTQDQLLKFYHDADCFVFPSRGEGFGLPPLEAMATGLPTIVARNSGMLEYADDRYNYGLECTGKIKADRFPTEWGNVGNLYESSLEDLKEKMLYIYNHQDEAKQKGYNSSQWVKNNFTYNHTAKRISELIQRVVYN